MFEKILPAIIYFSGILLFLDYLLFPALRAKDKIRRFSVGVLLGLYAIAGIFGLIGLGL